MLRFAGDDAFERWLKACPIDARALKYQVSRQGGVLEVHCSWSVAPAEADAAEQPAATPSGSLPPRAAALAPAASPPSEGGAAELARLRSSLREMQASLADAAARHDSAKAEGAAASPRAEAAAADASGMSIGYPGGGAALAEALLQKRTRDAAGEPVAATRQQIRDALALASGKPYPKPPGPNFEKK